MLKIYHNNRCSKSRETLELLRSRGLEPEVILYLTDTPSAQELKEVLAKLQMSPEEIIRKGEKLYKEQYAGKHLTYDEWIEVLVQNPVLIERPIVIKDDKAAIGRPPQSVLSIL